MFFNNKVTHGSFRSFDFVDRLDSVLKVLGGFGPFCPANTSGGQAILRIAYNERLSSKVQPIHFTVDASVFWESAVEK